ncbi:hypothetical protein FHX37_0648 [Haloactinospora alba]|uniref:Uncharacterized protein n=1 Tax=Haloactinospora alba TaxID=405555 RepID=A0A543NG40_9ACTN|nr:hypothetical protein FHX37_0648 [Haloactinospora alba]
MATTDTKGISLHPHCLYTILGEYVAVSAIPIGRFPVDSEDEQRVVIANTTNNFLGIRLYTVILNPNNGNIESTATTEKITSSKNYSATLRVRHLHLSGGQQEPPHFPRCHHRNRRMELRLWFPFRRSLCQTRHSHPPIPPPE